MAPSSPPAPPIPLAYRLFFLWIEPLATAVGAYYAHFRPQSYLAWTHPFPSPAVPATLLPAVPPVSRIVLTQLANLYLVFAINEALVLRATADRRVWTAFLLGLLIADVGHLYSVHLAGLRVYWEVWNWNAMYWGNVGFVYVGAMMRTAFLLGVGLGVGRGAMSAGGKGRRGKR